jgi:acetyl-CoA acetyltransferase
VRTDGAAAIVLRVGGGGPRISGIAHRIDAHGLGVRDLGRCPSARLAAEAAGALGSKVEVAELYAPYAHQELLLARELGLGGAVINPSGGALAAETPMVAGLVRILEAARAVRGGARRALAHASSGPCLQHNLVAMLEQA